MMRIFLDDSYPFSSLPLISRKVDIHTSDQKVCFKVLLRARSIRPLMETRAGVLEEFQEVDVSAI